MNVDEAQTEGEDDMTAVLEGYGPLLADGRATADGARIAERYKRVKALLASLEAEKDMLRDRLLEAAAEFPGVKSFPAGDSVITVTQTRRETVPVSRVREEEPTLYEMLEEGGFITHSTAQVLSVR